MKRLTAVCTFSVLVLALLALALLPVQAGKIAYELWANNGRDNSFIIQDLSTGRQQKISLGRLNALQNCLRFSLDGRQLVFNVLDSSRSGMNNRYVYTVDLSQAKPHPQRAFTGSSPCFVKGGIMYFADGGQIFVNNGIYFKYLDNILATAPYPDGDRFAIVQCQSNGNTSWIAAWQFVFR